GDDEVLGCGLRRHWEAHLLEHLDVQGRAHGHLCGHHAGQLLHLSAHLEQRDRVGVHTRAEVDMVAHAATSDIRAVVARSTPYASPSPELAPNDSRAARVLGSRSVPRAARWSRSGSATSPSSAHSSRVAERVVVRPRHRRTASSTSVVATPTAGWSASQPTRTSSPSGVRPSPRPIIEWTLSGVTDSGKATSPATRDRGVP